MGVFGEKLRKQREQQGIELDAISYTTKISTRMLRALEDEHFDQLPGGVFNKGFVRAYARQVGLNEEEAIADYLAAVRENQSRENQSRENQIQEHSSSPDMRDRVDHHPPVHDHPGNHTGDQLLTQDRRRQFRRKEDRRNEDRFNEAAPRQDFTWVPTPTSPGRSIRAPRFWSCISGRTSRAWSRRALRPWCNSSWTAAARIHR